MLSPATVAGATRTVSASTHSMHARTYGLREHQARAHRHTACTATVAGATCTVSATQQTRHMHGSCASRSHQPTQAISSNQSAKNTKTIDKCDQRMRGSVMVGTHHLTNHVCAFRDLLFACIFVVQTQHEPGPPGKEGGEGCGVRQGR